jgi:outer membrane protein assembly factor BamB
MSASLLSSLPLHAQQFADVKPTPTLFPTRLGLETKWQQFASEPVTPERLSSIMAEDPQGGWLIGWGEERQTSVWAAVRRRVTGDVKALAAVREADEGPAKALLASAETLPEIQSIARRFPWSDAAHRALVRAAERELRVNHCGLAERCFQDVLLWSGDAELKSRAQVGLWLVAAQDPQRSRIEEAFHGVDLEARYPWAGEPTSAGEIRKRLLDAAPEPAGVALKDLETHVLEVPGTACEHAVAVADGAAVAGPNLLVWFGKNSSKPAWSRVHPFKPSGETGATIAQGPMLPAVGDGRVYARWGIESATWRQDNSRIGAFPRRDNGPRQGEPRVFADVVATDTRTGKPVWSTAGNPEWQDLVPANDPTWADGRVYVLALSRSQEYSPVFLVCLDAASGAILWNRELVKAHTILGGAVAWDVAHQGNAVTVADGFVYCLTNVGVVECCDARDGMIEWARSYAQMSGSKVRPGSPPVVAGGNVIFLPRDSTALFGVERASGESKWNNLDCTAQRILGVWKRQVFVADSRHISAVDTAKGTVNWDKVFPSALDAGASLSGPSLYAGTWTKLRRLNADDGRIVEEKELEDSGEFLGMTVRRGMLFAIKRGKAVEAVMTPDVVVSADKPSRVVHRAVRPFPANGTVRDWEPHRPFTCTGSKLIKEKKVVVAHDDLNLYVGLFARGADREVRLSRIDVAVTIKKRTSHWAIVAGPRGEASWEAMGEAVAPGVRAAIEQDVHEHSATLTMIVPLEALFQEVAASNRGWVGVNLSIRCMEPDADYPLLEYSDNLYLSQLTEEQEVDVLSLVQAFPELDSAWQALEEIWRGRLPADATPADVYRDFIRKNPKSPCVGYALVRLDRRLRKTINSDPSGDVLQLAEQAGVPDEFRTWYRKLASAYLSQWVYIDTRYKTQQIRFMLFDGKSWEHAVDATPALVVSSDDGVIRVGPGGRPGKVAEPAETEDVDLRRITMPAAGSWQELRIPLIWLGMHDKPIHAVAFTQTGGSENYWDHLVLVVEGNETVLIGDDAGTDFLRGDWNWVDTPAREKGSKAHVTSHPVYSDQTVRHELYFRTPVVAHVRPAPVVARDMERLKLVQEKLPGMHAKKFAVEVCQWADPMLTNDVESRERLRMAILANVSNDEAVAWLQLFLRQEYRVNEKPVAAIDALIAKCKVKPGVVTEFHERSATMFLRRWQVLGPFANKDLHGGDAILPPEEDAIELHAEYPGATGKVSWKKVESETDRIDLQALLKHGKPAVAYAVCWVQADARSRVPVTIEVGSQDDIKLWINPQDRSQPVIDQSMEREAMPGQASAKIDLQPGWNEIRVKVASRSARSAFFFELRDESGNKPLKGIQVQTNPPGKRQQGDVR